MNNEEIEIDIDKESLFTLMLMAHEQDITLNQLIQNILREKTSTMDLSPDVVLT